MCGVAASGLVDLNVLDDQVAGIESLGICVCLCVPEQTEKEFGRLDGPASLGDTELLACTATLETFIFDVVIRCTGPFGRPSCVAT